MAELSCAELVELVTDYLDEALDSRTLESLLEHLADCPGCEHYVAQFRQIIRTLGGLPGQTLSPDARCTLLNAFRHTDS
jgi:hypothetical protein